MYNFYVPPRPRDRPQKKDLLATVRFEDRYGYNYTIIALYVSQTDLQQALSISTTAAIYSPLPPSAYLYCWKGRVWTLVGCAICKFVNTPFPAFCSCAS